MQRSPRFELKHLRYFLIAADQGSFRKAAAALGIQESSISRRIRDLEDELGASLFQRYNGGVRLTVAGESLQARARTIFREVDHGVADVSDIGRGARGCLRVGVIASIAGGFVAELLRDFGKRSKGVHIEIADGAPIEHLAAIGRFDLDVAFLMGTDPRCGFDTTALWRERLYVAVSDEHPLSKLGEVAWENLAGETFLIGETALCQDLRTLLTKRLTALGRPPLLQRQNVNCDNLLQLVAFGLGLVLTTEAVAGDPQRGIAYRPIAGETVAFSAVWSPKNDNPAFRRFLSMAKVRA